MPRARRRAGSRKRPKRRHPRSLERVCVERDAVVERRLAMLGEEEAWRRDAARQKAACAAREAAGPPHRRRAAPVAVPSRSVAVVLRSPRKVPLRTASPLKAARLVASRLTATRRVATRGNRGATRQRGGWQRDGWQQFSSFNLELHLLGLKLVLTVIYYRATTT